MAEKLNSKKILIFAVVLLVVFMTAFFAGCSSPTPEVNIPDIVGAIDFNIEDKAYGYLQDLAGEELKDRTLGTQGELDSAKYIASVMSDLGYESQYSSDGIQGLQGFKTSIKRFGGEEVADAQGYNVIFSKKSKAEKSNGEIILACQYDNLYSEKSDISGNLWSADGSYESGASVAILLTLAEALKDSTLDYDLTFAFFTCGCYGWKGAMNYVENLDRTQLDKIALVLNFAMLGGGDNWYIYTGESANSYGKYLYKCGEGHLTAVPKDRNPGQFYLTEDTRYRYTNIGMLSNQYYFDLKGIPTANFLSLNWEINDNPLFSEMRGKDNIYHTKGDTLENMIERKGEEAIKAQLFEVIRVTLTALDMSNQDTLKASLGVAKSELPNATAQNAKSANLANLIFKVVLIAGLVVASYVLKNYLNKNIDKYIKAKKAKETQASDGEETQIPFESGDAQSDVTTSQDKQKSEEKSKKEQDEDPFV
ncbi:MAG: M28 family peptidase [Clostridia bacterium]|nr:M28 family peptidase [Clostridia bacterium]